MNNTKKRSKIVSILLSILTPGLGHLYNGKFIWAITVPIIVIIISSILYYFSLLRSFTILLFFAAFIIIIYIFSVVHSIILANRNSSYQLKNYNHVYIYLIWPIIFFGIEGLLPENNTLKPFKIPTNSMANTLKADDMILADMDYYKHREVKKNDIVLFSAPKSPHELTIKRAVALEGEKITIVNGKIFINGQECKEDNPNIIYENDTKADLDETVVPKDQIFFIGDNRPNSLDSRMFGFVPEKNVRGKPLYIYFSSSFDRIGMNLE